LHDTDVVIVSKLVFGGNLSSASHLRSAPAARAGAAHFPGLFAELQQRDPNFAIHSVKGVRPMTLPDELKLAPTAVVGTAK
jgi:hypothetical protein